MSGQQKQIVLTATVVAVIALIIGLGAFYLQPRLSGNGSSSGTLSSTTSSSRNSTSPTSTTTSITGSLSSTSTRTGNYTSILLSTSTTSYDVQQCNSLTQMMMGGAQPVYIPYNGTLDVCVQFYYYNSNPYVGSGIPESFNLRNETKIYSFSSSGYQMDSSTNFSISIIPSTSNNVSIGGISNESEGFLVMYEITPKANTNGTYVLDFGQYLYAGGSTAYNCGQDYTIISGNGLPNYSLSDHICHGIGTGIAWSNSSGGSSSGITNVPYQTLLAKVLGATNSANPSATP